jgi:hypothetical protein
MVWERDDYDCDFQDPGGQSALRRATKSNPRNRPCPTCGKPNKLTPRDVALHYQCDECADRAEGTYVGSDY